ncbi:hypothetical protein QVD17_04778 [Tagetes erecta]|uniref:Uncharacterized protein n=1 Tax=Tagetes erecta TaxID=13708 RepID=A0AAD8LAS6_TARER|nr:hypothetical protein QVD17_04778 [Tagetes erecta]
MGTCTSCHSTHHYALPTGKLILPDGRLQQFFHPTKVSDVLHNHPSTFICNSDEMDFDDVVSPIKNDDDLQLGQLYFALPLKRLNHPLQPEEMAALAVKASAALAKCGGSKNICFMTSFSGEKKRVKSSGKVADVQTIGLSRKSSVGSGGGGCGKKKSFKAMLSVIPE